MKQTEDNKPVVEQHNIQVHQQKQEEQLAHKVQDTQEKENFAFRYDAKEKGSNAYEGNGGRKGQKKKKEDQSEGKVIFKGQKSSFDIKI